MLNKIKSVMLGHAVGDALGVPVEFSKREKLKNNPVTSMCGFGAHNVPAGTWSDDTSMSLCALNVLIVGSLDYDKIMENFGDWYYNDDFTATDVMFDVGNACAQAIEVYFSSHTPAVKCGGKNEWSNGNGSLMRIHPFVLYAYYNGKQNDNEFVSIISDASSLTHAHQCSIDGCVMYAYILKEILDNQSKQSVYVGIDKAKDKIKTKDRYHRLLNVDIANANEDEIKSSGYVVDSLEAAIWCLLTTDNYKDCVLKAVNLGEDTDTVAAIAGGLAGALYGIETIPRDWLKTLKRESVIESMCEEAYSNWRR